jgi:hypothetical protein
VLLGTLAPLVGAGCVGYRLGTTLPPGVKSIYVPSFVNQTEEPQVDTVATQAAIREFQRDGTVERADADTADAVLQVTVVRYTLEPLRFDRDRAKTAREYRLRLTAKLEFKRIDTGEVLAERKVQGEADFELLGNLASAKIEALPDAAEDLAHDIVETIVEHW